MHFFIFSKSYGGIMLEKKEYATAFYLRLSHEERGGEESKKIKNQKAALFAYIQNKPEFQWKETFCDNGYTGTNFQRPQWQKLIEQVQKGIINCIMVKDLSRLGRNYRESGVLLESFFPLLGVRFIAVEDGYDSEQRKEMPLIVPLKNVLNDFYAKDLSKKIKSARQAQRKRGEFIGSVTAYGYERDKEKKGLLIPCPQKASVVKQIFLWAVQGFSPSQIAQKLNAYKVLSPKGGTWQYQSIKRILKNPVYTGVLYEGEKQTHEPIISKELFDCVRIQKNK